ncbi:hypothetical protein SPI_02860 [Niveomyces insectorum RCEF 264]|uniref:Uncharacterized protein n=1 Tax=Niveomyces insectorum RCEF 264 TaxID=1081102 RepID=A0A167WUZ7_9HYPO|nr:hypothetical protein SPI_02860 [Niveomyces insectorum RCEF 264]
MNLILTRRRGKPGDIWNGRPIVDWAALIAQHTPQTAYVAIDLEGVHKQRSESIAGVSELGVAIVPPPVLQKQRPTSDDNEVDSSAFPKPSLVVDDLIRDHDIQSVSFRIQGRPLTRNAIRNQEALCLYDTVWVEEEDIEDRLLTLLTSTRDRFNQECGRGSRPVSMVLVGYAMAMEYRVLCASFPRVVSSGLFSAWCDLGELVHQSLGHRTSLSNSLSALGYPYGAFVHRKRSRLHRAGNDVVRELTVLLHILHFYQTTTSLPAGSRSDEDSRHAEETDEAGRRKDIADDASDKLPDDNVLTTGKTYNAATGQDRQQHPLSHPFQYPMRPPRIKAPTPERREASEHRPSPHSDYPFTVSLRPENGGSMRAVARDARALRALFAAYDPVTTVMHPDKTRSWICLPNEEQRDRFVHDVHGNVRFGVEWRARALPVEAPPRGVSRRERVRQIDRRLPGNEHVQEETQKRRSAWRETIKDDEGLEALRMLVIS